MQLSELLTDSSLRGRVILALQHAIVADFSRSDWIEIGYETGEHEYIERHDRLLRSLHWGDDDYGACVFQALRYFAERRPEALGKFIEHDKIRSALERDAPDVLSDLGLAVGRVPAVAPKKISASEVVERALDDAENLLRTGGAISAMDRLHTALHGYLRKVCTDAGIVGVDGASITAIFKELRTGHPAFQDFGAHDADLVRILTGFASVIDAVNTIRNKGSVAHPNELLGDDEAELVVNAIRTMFHYISAKIRGNGVHGAPF